MVDKKKSIFVVLVLFLAVGFATVATNLVLKGDFTLAANTADFDVSFSSAILDGADVSSSAISADGKTLTFSSGELVYVDDVSILEYTVVNNSKQYDVDVAMECTLDSLNYVSIINDFETQNIPARNEVSGVLTATLVNASVTNQDINVECTLVSDAVDRTEVGSDDIITDKSHTFSIYGILTDENGTALANQALVIYSSPIYAITDSNGYFYVDGLEKGNHDIYVMGNKTLSEVQNLTEDEVKSSAISKSSFTTGSLNVVFENGYHLTTSTIEKTIKFTVKFDVNGGSTLIEDREVTRGLTYGELPTQTRTGYTFLGYYDPDGNKIESDTKVSQRKSHTVTVKWEANRYDVTLNPDGGTFASIGDWITTGNNLTKTIVYDEYYGKLPNPVKDGYKFEGWYLDDTLIDSSIRMNELSAHTLVAKWVSVDVDIVVYANGGTFTSTTGWIGDSLTVHKTVAYGNVYGTLPTVVKKGYDFLGWFSSDGEEITESTLMLQLGTHSIVAKWKGVEYTVTFDASGGFFPKSYLDSREVYFDVTTGKTCSNYLSANSNIGYNGIGGNGTTQNGCLKFYSFLDSDNNDRVKLLLDHTLTESVAWSTSGSNSSGPVTILAQLKTDTNSWVGTLTPTNHTVAQSGYANYTIDYSGYKARLITIGEVAKITKFTSFSENTTANTWFYLGSGNQTDSSQVTKYSWLYSATSPSTIGFWTASSAYGNSYVAWFVNYEGYVSDYGITRTIGVRPVIEVDKVTLMNNNTTSLQIAYGGDYGALPIPVRTGYAFNGWYTSDGVKVSSTTNLLLPSNHTLYAKWS